MIKETDRGPNYPRVEHKKVRTEASHSDESHRWWDIDDEEIMAETLNGSLKILLDAQRHRQRNLSSCSRMYGENPIFASWGVQAARLSRNHPASRITTATYNAVQIAADTSVCAIAKTRPRAYALTDGGSYKLKRKAKKLNQLIDGVFYQSNVNKLAPMVYRDGLIWGVGTTHVYPSFDRVVIERVPAFELWIDELEALAGNPRQLYRIHLVDKQVLAEMFPDKHKLVEDSALYDDPDIRAHRVSNLTTVVDAWHLPSSPEAKDGKHVLTVTTGPLVVEEYTKPYFPFSFLHWSQPQTGFWGMGAVEQARNVQFEIDHTSWVIQITHKKGGSAKIWIEEGSNVVDDHLTNEPWAIAHYRGTPPVYLTPAFCPPETYQYLQSLKQQVFEIFGINQLSARSAKPEGLESGEALREYRDQTSERLILANQNYEDWHLQTARLVLDAVKVLAEENRGHFKVKVPGSKFLSEIDWRDIDLEDESFVLQILPTSQLPKDPAARLQTLTEIAQAGLISQRELRIGLEFPDLQSIETLKNASSEWIRKCIDQIVDDGIYTAPEVFDDLKEGIEVAMENYQLGKEGGLEEERLGMLRCWMAQCRWLLSQGAPPPQPAAPGSGPPMAQAAPLPQSPMLPNVLPTAS